MVRIVETSNEHLAAIGLVAVRWSWVDSVMADIAGLMLEDHRSGVDMIFGKGASVSRFGEYRKWSETQSFSDDDKEIISRATLALSALWDERNNITHSPFGFGHQWDKKTKNLVAGIGYNKNRGRRHTFVPCPPERLLRHADAVLDAAYPLWELREERAHKELYPYDPR